MWSLSPTLGARTPTGRLLAPALAISHGLAVNPDYDCEHDLSDDDSSARSMLSRRSSGFQKLNIRGFYEESSRHGSKKLRLTHLVKERPVGIVVQSRSDAPSLKSTRCKMVAPLASLKPPPSLYPLSWMPSRHIFRPG